jgi:hypothetical protein
MDRLNLNIGSKQFIVWNSLIDSDRFLNSNRGRNL